MEIGQMLFEAMESKYQAELKDAEARLAVYFNNPVAIGEHPQHTEEIDHLIEQRANAKDKLENLKEVQHLVIKG
jgi:hypothetical protein